MTTTENKARESLIESLRESTSIDSNTLTSFFDWETKSQDEKKHEDHHEHALRTHHYFEPHTEDEGKLEFTVNTSFFVQNMTIIENSNLPEPDVKLAFTSTKNFMIGCFMLFLMVVPSSIIGPMTISLPAKNVYVQATWRYQG